MSPEVLADVVMESDPVRRWRLYELIRAGYQATDALILSQRPEIDLHRAVELLERGCPPETALRILL
jgi:hypothetical protein